MIPYIKVTCHKFYCKALTHEGVGLTCGCLGAAVQQQRQPRELNKSQENRKENEHVKNPLRLSCGIANS